MYDEDLKIKEVKDFINKNITINLHRDELAKMAYLSVWSFSKKFKEYVGESFEDYIDNLKLNYAKKLISEERLSIREIAEKLGYSQPKHFCMYFKKRTSKTPFQYRSE